MPLSTEAWAKYTAAADYDQNLHRDYLNHTVLVLSDDAGCQQLELFVYLVDAPEPLGPPHLQSGLGLGPGLGQKSTEANSETSRKPTRWYAARAGRLKSLT